MTELLTDKEKAEINETLIMLINTSPKTDFSDEGMYYIWDYLEEQGHSPHVISQYIETNGQLLIGKALLSKMVEL